MIRLALLLAALPAAASAHGPDPDATYVLRALGGAPVEVRATIRFPDAAVVLGEGPCNAFRATRSLPHPRMPHPRIALGPVAATRRACPALEVERDFFDALHAVTRVEVENGELRLLDADGPVATFRSE